MIRALEDRALDAWKVSQGLRHGANWGRAVSQFHQSSHLVRDGHPYVRRLVIEARAVAFGGCSEGGQAA